MFQTKLTLVEICNYKRISWDSSEIFHSQFSLPLYLISSYITTSDRYSNFQNPTLTLFFFPPALSIWIAQVATHTDHCISWHSPVLYSLLKSKTDLVCSAFSVCHTFYAFSFTDMWLERSDIMDRKPNWLSQTSWWKLLPYQ